MPDVNLNRSPAPGFDPRLFLRDEELDYGISLLLTAERSLKREAGHLIDASALSGLAVEILLIIRFSPGLGLSVLRQQLGASSATLARTLAELDKKGLLERRKDENDGRAKLLFLTVEGKRFTDPATIAMRNVLRGAYRRAGVSAVVGTRAVLQALKS
ncbi:MAG: Uncharacterised protein [Hyphomonas sp. TMED17]|nr:MAG: Uncharacterised protein [Hyphomonas sp. TMED17]